ncbi:MAG: glycosyltransferase [Lachnospiraceae bacterium]
MRENKIRILYVTEAFDGGIYRFLLELANQLADRAQIYIAYDDNNRMSMFCKDDFAEKIKLIPMAGKCFSHRNLNCLAGIRKYRKLVKQIQPDVVHVHSSVAGMWGRWAFIHNPCATFYTPHGFAFLNEKPKWKMFIYRWVERISATRPCRIIACGMKEFQIAKSFRKDSICVLNGINLKQMQLSDDLEDVGLKKQLEVLTVSRNVWQKNPALFNAIAERLPEVSFVWVGDEKKDDLVEENIETTGLLTHDDVIRRMKHADIFILTSVFEGLSLALLEAMSLKKICIVSNVSGNCEVIENGVNGFLCNDLDEFVNTIRMVENEKEEKLQQIRMNAYRTVVDKYNSEKMADQYYDIYQEAVRNQNRHGIDRRFTG